MLARIFPRRGRPLLLALLTIPVFVALTAPRASADAKKQVFVRAKEAFANKAYAQAANLCWRYIATAPKGADKYESAQFFLAASLEQLGLYHAAVAYYFHVANNRQTPQLLPRAVQNMERIHLDHPIDESLVLRDLVGDTDFGRLPGDLGDFVHYWQGVSNLHRGLHEWANERLRRISRTGYYVYAALYLASIRLLGPEKPKVKRLALESFAELFGPLDLAAALESLRRRGESDSTLAYSLKALINEDNQIKVRFRRMPPRWEIDVAMLGLARVAAETEVLLARSKETDDEELGRPFSYQVQIGGIPIYRRSPRFEDRAPMIKGVASRQAAVRKVHAQALHGLARLLYEQKRFAAAYDTLGQIPPGTELSSEILLERAWAKYQAGDPHRAMGLLYALDAPVYSNLFAPEKYVLRGLIYRRFCHFRAAKVAARRYRVDYSRTLREIRAGKPLPKIKRVLAAALRRGDARRLYLFGRSLRNEYALLKQYKDVWAKSKLYQNLRNTYRTKRRQIRTELDSALEVTAREVAEQMLHTEEQVYLLEYEVGQAIFERVSETTGAATLRKPTPKVPISSARVYYRFADEYWTDELPRFKFNIEDRCVE